MSPNPGAKEQWWEWLEGNEWAQELIAGDDTIWQLLDVYSRQDPDRPYATLLKEIEEWVERRASFQARREAERRIRERWGRFYPLRAWALAWALRVPESRPASFLGKVVMFLIVLPAFLGPVALIVLLVAWIFGWQF